MAARATGTQARFVSGSATDLFHRSRFLTDSRCRTLGYVLLRPNAPQHNAMQSIKSNLFGRPIWLGRFRRWPASVWATKNASNIFCNTRKALDNRRSELLNLARSL